MMIKFNLDRLMFERGNMKVPELERVSGVNRNTLYGIYNNKVKRVDLSVLERICNALDCTPCDLLVIERG